MSPFIRHISSPGLIEMPPESKVTPLPTSTSVGRSARSALCPRMISFGSCSDSSATAMKMPMPSALHSARPSTSKLRPVARASASARSATIVGVIRLAGVLTRSRASSDARRDRLAARHARLDRRQPIRGHLDDGHASPGWASNPSAASSGSPRNDRGRVACPRPARRRRSPRPARRCPRRGRWSRRLRAQIASLACRGGSRGAGCVIASSFAGSPRPTTSTRVALGSRRACRAAPSRRPCRRNRPAAMMAEIAPPSALSTAPVAPPGSVTPWNRLTTMRSAASSMMLPCLTSMSTEAPPEWDERESWEQGLVI